MAILPEHTSEYSFLSSCSAPGVVRIQLAAWQSTPAKFSDFRGSRSAAFDAISSGNVAVMVSGVRHWPPGFVRPCQPVISLKVPVGDGWIHELKHDGFRIIARKERDHVRLWSRNGRNWSAEFVAITAALGELPADFVLDGEAVAHCSHGLPDFHGLLGRDGKRTACLYAFDLLHLRATDLRPVELVGRRAMLKKLIPRQDRC